MTPAEIATTMQGNAVWVVFANVLLPARTTQSPYARHSPF